MAKGDFGQGRSPLAAARRGGARNHPSREQDRVRDADASLSDVAIVHTHIPQTRDSDTAADGEIEPSDPSGGFLLDALQRHPVVVLQRFACPWGVR
jgi:hypothetical protein